MFYSNVRGELVYLATTMKPRIARFCKLEAALCSGPDDRRRGARSQPAGGRRQFEGSYAPSWEMQRAARSLVIDCVAAACRPTKAAAPLGDAESFYDAVETLPAEPARPGPVLLVAEAPDSVVAGPEALPDPEVDSLREKHPAAEYLSRNEQKRQLKQAKRAAQKAGKEAQKAEVAALLAEDAAPPAVEAEETHLPAEAEAVPCPGLEDKTADPGVQSSVSSFDPRASFERAAAIAAARPLEVPASDALGRPRSTALLSKVAEVAPLAEAEAEYDSEADFEQDEYVAEGDFNKGACPRTCRGYSQHWVGHAPAWCSAEEVLYLREQGRFGEAEALADEINSN
jgi:hypothetical protein